MVAPAATPAAAPRVCPWLGDRRWVYSITFDEALSELHRFAVALLAEFGVPGHVEVVVGQMGQVRAIGTSSYNGFHHMGPAELRDLLARGWGVGNHSWTHQAVNADTAAQELGEAKQVLEAALAAPVTIYCSPGDNGNMNDGALAACRRYGYLGAMSITDALNRPDPGDPDPLWLNRTFLHTQGYGPFFSAFDPFRNLAFARRERGWVIDYCHCPLERAVHPNKDCSVAELRDRLATVRAEGGADVWLARVEDAVDYRYTRRATVVAPVGPGVWQVSAPGLPAAVRRRVVTLALPADTHAATVDGQPVAPGAHSGGPLLDLDLTQPRTLRLVP